MRVKGVCIGDCSKCDLLANGDVDMIPCVLDQIFQRVRKNEKDISSIAERLDVCNKVVFSGVEPIDEIPKDEGRVVSLAP